MNPCELTVAISALASSIARCLSDDELSLLAAVLTQLGDTLATISVQREICEAHTADTK
ncbi:hypothetical protein H8711_06210 [Clostridiaceae bacterium NSJ-31]|uniref:DUF6774 domain-containing protein n=1 Tax=Ligaoa zhengdingensis TaxID=2763658 RepID=A0A926DXB7_9FIRM|nr:DUF6774 domain-containing protein [Ligaoa zhengdingensis]MBC8546526.1 hypothetical protein [Ligaoa zhengdingensis]